MNRERAKLLWPIIKAYGEGETIQHQGDNDFWYELLSGNDYDAPFSNGEVYRIKPEEIEIDMSVLIKSSIDCEFSDCIGFEETTIGALVDVNKGLHERYPFKSSTNQKYLFARPRMNRLHAWVGGDCPLPKGVRVRLYLRSGGAFAGDATTFDWSHLPSIDHIISFEVIGLEAGYVHA